MPFTYGRNDLQQIGQRFRVVAVQSDVCRAFRRGGNRHERKAQGALEVLGYTADAGFLSRRVTPELLQKAYIIICMTEYQREQLFGYENAELFSDGEVPDPYGGSDEDYLRTAIMLQRGILELTDRLRASRII